MKITGNPGPDKITITFEEGEFNGKSLTMEAEPIRGGIVLYATTIKGWDSSPSTMLDPSTRKVIVEFIRNELKKFPPSEIVE